MTLRSSGTGARIYERHQRPARRGSHLAVTFVPVWVRAAHCAARTDRRSQIVLGDLRIPSGTRSVYSPHFTSEGTPMRCTSLVSIGFVLLSSLALTACGGDPATGDDGGDDIDAGGDSPDADNSGFTT